MASTQRSYKRKGAVLNGPLFGMNWAAEGEVFKYATLPPIGPVSFEPEEPYQGGSVTTSTYFWENNLEAWMCHDDEPSAEVATLIRNLPVSDRTLEAHNERLRKWYTKR